MSTCSAWSRLEALDPIGSAPEVDGFLLLPWPLPWPADLGDVALLHDVWSKSDELEIRVQGIVDNLKAPTDVTLYRKAADHSGFRGYTATRRAALGPDEVIATALALLAEEPPEAHHDAAPTDVLICTHGKRDRCCGSLGTSLFSELHQAELGCRVQRTSHTGGHRFAPTGVVLPEGTLWAELDQDLMRRILDRSGPIAEVLPHYRGCTGLHGGPAAQVIERAALARLGWALLDAARTTTVLPDGRIRLDVTMPDGSEHSWEGRVDVGRTLPLPQCGQPAAAATKSVSEYVLGDLISLAPA